MSSSRQHGAFVYKGSGKRQDESAPAEQRLCTKEACAIQYCLARYNHQEKWCVKTIEAWKTCCEKVKAAEARRINGELTDED